MADTNLELRAYWETKLAKVRVAIEDANEQLLVQRITLQSEMDALEIVQKRVELANHKLAAAEKHELELISEVEHIKQTIEALRGNAE